jgi:hypothetical protein
MLTMRILIFLLEHNFMVADLGFDKRESFFRTTQGIPTGAKNSGDLANLALLNRENRIYENLKAKGLTLLLQNRYIDDGTLAWTSPQSEVEINLKLVTSAYNNGFPAPIKFDWAEKAMHLPLHAQHDTITESPKREYLDLNIHYIIENTPAGSRLTLHHTTYKKACSGDLYIHWHSSHKKDEKINLPLNQRQRFLINSSHKTYFDESWSTFREILIARKYPPEELDIIEEKIQWNQKHDIIQTRSEKKKRKLEGRQTFSSDERGKTDWIVLAGRPGSEKIQKEIEKFRTEGYRIPEIRDFTIPLDMRRYGFLVDTKTSKSGTMTLGTLMSIRPPSNPTNDDIRI